MARTDEEKRALLRRLCQAQFFSSMSIEELRLYLLLLAAAEEIGKKEVIDLEIVRRALGEWSRADLKRLGLGLFKKGLAEVALQPGRALPSRLAFTVFGLRKVRRDEAKWMESRRRKHQGPGCRRQREDPRGDR